MARKNPPDFYGERRRTRLPRGVNVRFFAIFIPASLGLLAVALVFAVRLTRNPERLPPTQVRALDGKVRIPVSALGDGTMRRFDYVPAGGDRSLRFFIAVGKDGVYHAAWDACEDRYERGVGFTKVSCDMECGLCGTRTCVVVLGKPGSGCRPAFLPHRVDDAHVLVLSRDLDEGRKHFGIKE